MDSKALFKLGYGLYLLSSKDERDSGCIVNTVTQITDSPFTVAVAVNRQNYTHELIKKSGKFNVSVLSEKTTMDTIRRFGFSSGRDGDKFSDRDPVAGGIKYFADTANAYICGEVIKEVDCGTHTIFIALITDMAVLSDDETMTYSYYHKHVKPKPAKKKARGWQCSICGYIYEGETLPPDFICPICKHGAADFVRLEE